MCCEGRAIRFVATLTKWVSVDKRRNSFLIIFLRTHWSGQLRFLGVKGVYHFSSFFPSHHPNAATAIIGR